MCLFAKQGIPSLPMARSLKVLPLLMNRLLPANLPRLSAKSGGDKSSVTGGTKVLSDRIKVMVTTQPGESFLDKMIALVEGASRQKTPNEIALTILLAGFTLIFVIVCVTLKAFWRLCQYAYYYSRIYLTVCLFDPYNYRWPFIGHRYCGDGQGVACQCDHQIGQSC